MSRQSDRSTVVRPRGRALLVAAITVAVLAVAPELGRAFDRLGAERELVTLTNAARTSNELPSLRPHDGLIGVARSRSEDMAVRDYFSHEIPPENYYFDRLLDAEGIAYTRAAENIARNNRTDAESVRRAQAGFLSSPAHRANILDPLFREIGAGAWDRVDGMKYFTVLFLRAPDVARPAPPAADWLAEATAAPREPSAMQAMGAALGDMLGAPRTAHAQAPGESTAEVSAVRPIEAQDTSPAAPVATRQYPRGAVTAAPPAPLGLLDSIITRVLKLYLSL
jgi:uncharacterized protein YkwD